MKYFKGIYILVWEENLTGDASSSDLATKENMDNLLKIGGLLKKRQRISTLVLASPSKEEAPMKKLSSGQYHIYKYIVA